MSINTQGCNTASPYKNMFIYMLRLSLMVAVALLLPTKALAQTSPQATYYVDPVNGNDGNSGTSLGSAFQTIAKARDVVRTVNTNMTGDIYVYLRGGTHWLTSTLTLTDVDSGTNGYNIIYSAYNGEKPVLSGGKKIINWTLHNSCENSCQSIYKAHAGDIDTRQLYVNGKRAIRARSTVSPSGLTFDINTGYTVSGDLYVNSSIPMDQWTNTNDIEFVYNNVFAHYRTSTSIVTSDGTSTTITMKQPGWSYATTPNKGGTRVQSSYPPDYIENAYELLDTEGEWYLNKTTDTIYYKPNAGEEMSTSEVIVPVLEELLRIQGTDIGQKAANIQFYNIAFNYAGWLRSSGNNGHTTAQNGVIAEAVPAPAILNIVGAAVNLKYADRLKFDGCVFEHLGGAGLNIYGGCQDNLIVGSRFMDISANGIQAGDYNGYLDASSDNYYNPSDARLILRNNDIYNSYFSYCGVEYFSSSGIAAAFPQDMDIVHNEIGNMPYTGIHIGWGWIGISTSVMKNNRVNNNYIFDLNQVCIDGGAIYTNGPTSGNSSLKGGYFTGNYLKNSNWYSMYNDEGSSWYEWSNNVVDAATQYAFTWRSNNILYDSTYTNVSGHTGGTVTNTVLVSGAWPAAAQTIIDNAGLEQAYQGIKPVTPPNMNLYEIFDSMTEGDAPAGWSVNTAGGDGSVTVQGIVPNANDKNMKLSKTGTTSGVDLVSSHGLTPIYAGTVEVKAKADQTNAITLPIVLKSGSTAAVEIAFKSNGQIAYKNTSGTWVDVQAYTAGTWYNFKLEFDVVTDTYNFYIDSVQKLTNQPFAITSAAIDTFTCVINSASAGTANVDDVKVYEGYTARDNVSLNKTVTSFSSQYNTTGYKAANINDGVVGAVTSNERGWASVSGSGTRNEWVKINLGQNYTVSSFTIQNEDGADGRNVKDYVLYGSATGAFAGEEFVIASGTIPSLTALATHTVNFTPIDTKYIKFLATSSYSTYVIVGELSLFGVLGVQPPPPPTTVSLNKTVTGFSSQYNTTGFKAANINDGTVGAITSNERGWASVSGSGTRNEWVKIDLGQTYTLSSFVITNEDGANGRNVKDYVLYGSSTGTFTGEEFVISSGTIPSLAALATHTVNFTAADARYIKFKGTSSYSSYVIVGELSVYGVEAPPSPTPIVVSQNKTVTGFSSQYNTTGYKAANINDGTVGNVSSNERGWASVSGSGVRNEWVTIDLGQSYTMSSFVIQNEDGANGRNVKDYVLYGSATGAFAGEEFVISSGTIPSLTSLATHTVNFTPASARYVKFKGTSSYSSYVIVGELSLYGN